MKINDAKFVLFIHFLFIFLSGLFLSGFFPFSFSSDTKSSQSDIPSQIDGADLDPATWYQPKHSKLILVIIDAWRLSFLSEQMMYITGLLDSGEACKYQLRVHPPTVTMPRIKAMTSGSIPSFIDVVLNLGSSEMKTDTILHQFQAKGDNIVFYGDNTWANMFPGMFYRYVANQDSLFVNDFYEGDRNITKRLKTELKNNDWKMMILHYLGLDHIGHVEGPNSGKVPEKLQEMDDVIQEIHGSMKNWRKRLKTAPLLVITGDHGMRDTGGHGGSSFGEIHVPFVVIGSNCTNSKEMYQQTDIATTLATLFGLPIPAASIGTVIGEMLGGYNPLETLYTLYYTNERLMDKILQSNDEEFVRNSEFFLQHEEAKLSHKILINYPDDVNTFKKAQLKYTAAGKEMRNLLTLNYLNYDILSIAIGLVMTTVTVIVFGVTLVSDSSANMFNVITKYSDTFTITLFGLLFKHFVCKLYMQQCSFCSNTYCWNTLWFVVLLSMCVNVQLLKATRVEDLKDNFSRLRDHVGSFAPLFLVFGSVFHTFSAASSSFIEEEHQTWYYLCNTMFVVLALMEVKQNFAGFERNNALFNVKTPPALRSQGVNKNVMEAFKTLHNLVIKWTFFFVVHVILRRLNQTGDKFLHIPDIGDWLVLPDKQIWLSVMLFLGLVLTLVVINDYTGVLSNVLSLTAAVLIYYYRTISGAVLLTSIKPSKSRTSLLLFWLNILEIFLVNYIPSLYKWMRSSKWTDKDMSLSMGANITIFVLVGALLHKPHNVVLLAGCIFTSHVINSACNCLYVADRDHKKRMFVKIVLHLWLGRLFYFYQGNSNSLASIDLNAGYVGLNSFNFTVVGVFLTMNTFSAPILCHLLVLYHLYEDYARESCFRPAHTTSTRTTTDHDTTTTTSSKTSFEFSLTLFIKIQTFTILLSFTFYLFIVTLFKNHIFVWTVFSPKLIYDFYYLCLAFVLNIFFYNKARR